jgi:hypothetical protein
MRNPSWVWCENPEHNPEPTATAHPEQESCTWPHYVGPAAEPVMPEGLGSYTT